VTHSFIAPAEIPPPGLVGLEERWSRLVPVPSTDGVGRAWHVLDSQNGQERPAEATLTVLCVHGNPSWSYLWRRVLADAPDGVRVIAVDQLDMGFSERTGQRRRLATRVDDLCELTDELDIDGPVVTVAHDWGGPISLGWALRHRSQLAGTVLLNTSVHQPAGSPAPSVIRLIRSRGVLRRVTVDTSAFVAGAAAMSHPRLPSDIRAGLAAPYLTSDRRHAIGHFVEDIPLDSQHPSAATLDEIAAGLEDLADVPALLLWGPRDQVFSDLYLHDLEQRLPHAEVHRYPGAGHFVSEDADVSSAVHDWLDTLTAGPPDGAVDLSPAQESAPKREPLWSGYSNDDLVDDVAVIEMGPSEPSITFGYLRDRIDAVAAGLAEAGLSAGERVALMIPPGIDLCTALYGCWRAGAVVVLVDSGLGPKGMSQAVRAAHPQMIIGIPKALVAARSLNWPGRRICTSSLPPKRARLLGVEGSLESLAAREFTAPPTPESSAPAAVVFTSGATGPSKGVTYSHEQLQAQRDALVDLYEIDGSDRLVAAFAPFALYGPAMGIASVVPDMDLSKPATLTAESLGDAALAVNATMVFASPAALVNVLRTADQLDNLYTAAFAKVRLVLSAGAPVRTSLLRAVAELFPNAQLHTPYGMTEILPVADISLDEIVALGAASATGDGVCVGRPVAGVEVLISTFASDLSDELTSLPGCVGEIVVRGDHVRSGYDRLWHTANRASHPAGWHRTGDVGHLDSAGRLWVGGRLGHVVHTADGPVAPVGLEQAIELLEGVEAAAVVGVGPVGSQVLVAVVELSDGGAATGMGDLALHDRVREAAHTIAAFDVAAVLTVPKLPVDRRHNSKVDRTRLAVWSERVLRGDKVGKP
jgi:acyl-CoA synthetase (AMP-forming)/AMP-acid ligase II/pimeloyl-ACP methyl ester carboxylesterase